LVDMNYTILTGKPTQFKITFDATANSVGIKNVAYTNLNLSSGIITFSVPEGVPAGVYKGTLKLGNELGIESDNYAFQFTVNLSNDFIVSKWKDVVTCDNSTNRFMAYQWYKNGVIVDGATEQYYNDPLGLDGEYSVKVTTTDGQTFFTCPKSFNTPLNKSIKVYPNPVKVNRSCTVEIQGYEPIELKDATLSVYSNQGVCVSRTTNVTNINSLTLPNIPQLYIGKVILKNGTSYDFKVIVEQ